MKAPKVAVIIQARMGSSRLPGKVLKMLAGRTVLAHVIERCQQIPLVSEVIVATSTQLDDEPIVEEAKKQGVASWRGSETDVLSRYVEASRLSSAEAIVRVTSDCPLLDCAVSGMVTTQFAATSPDYCSNTLERSFPRGLDTEIFSLQALYEAHEHARHAADREHVTKYINEHPQRFRLQSVKGEQDFSRYRWTLDTEEDWQLISEIYRELYDSVNTFAWTDVLQLMARRPELHLINAHIEQKKV